MSDRIVAVPIDRDLGFSAAFCFVASAVGFGIVALAVPPTTNLIYVGASFSYITLGTLARLRFRPNKLLERPEVPVILESVQRTVARTLLATCLLFALDIAGILVGPFAAALGAGGACALFIEAFVAGCLYARAHKRSGRVIYRYVPTIRPRVRKTFFVQ